jgi:hypothetical protein
VTDIDATATAAPDAERQAARARARRWLERLLANGELADTSAAMPTEAPLTTLTEAVGRRATS